MKKRIGISVVLITALLFSFAAACRSGSSDKITIVAVDAGWDSQQFHSALARMIIENAFEGYQVRFSTASSQMNWESMKNGDVDLFIECWIDTYTTYQEDVRNGDIVEIGILLRDSNQGIYVPRYVIEGDPARGIAPMTPTLRRVEDLLRYSHVFPDDENPARARLYGSLPGWTTDEILFKKYEYHGLDRLYNYMRLGSEAALFASLMSAYNLGEPWVGYCYEPTWIAGKLDLVLLQDVPFEPVAYLEGRTAFPSSPLMIVGSSQFPAKAPEIVEFLGRFQTGSDLISQTLAYLDETRASHEAAALWFLRNNDGLIDEWLPAENAQRLRRYLSQRQ